MATRKASGKVLNVIADYIPTMIGGSADLSESNNTLLVNYPNLEADTPTGRNIHFGVREHAMGAILNGMAYHGGILPYGGTFLIFSDYMRPTNKDGGHVPSSGYIPLYPRLHRSW
ncbi:MAG: hypothetical protein Q9N34_08820 [Aquificota bacterium]|nr:hypothetical protein [Aquificota bacterium]